MWIIIEYFFWYFVFFLYSGGIRELLLGSEVVEFINLRKCFKDQDNNERRLFFKKKLNRILYTQKHWIYLKNPINGFFKAKHTEMLVKYLIENGSTSIWVDILWFTLVLIISPALFLFTMAISELPVMIVRQIFRIFRIKYGSLWENKISIDIGSRSKASCQSLHRISKTISLYNLSYWFVLR